MSKTMSNDSTAARGLAVAVGTFDGVHLGHRMLIAGVVEAAQSRGLVPAVVTFAQHPLTHLRPERVPASLATREVKRATLSSLGIEQIIELNFDASLAQLTAEEFLTLMRDRYGVACLVLGFNTVMGSDRVGDLDTFRAIAQRLAIDVVRVDEYSIDTSEMPVCSSTIRHLISLGHVRKAAELLGRNYSITGRVVHGKGLGHQIGFPTANIEPHPAGQALPVVGVYACRAYLRGEDDTASISAMVNIGHCPTIDADNTGITIEAHLIDMEGYLYGRDVTLEFVARLRDEKRFESLQELTEQLQADKRAALHALS